MGSGSRGRGRGKGAGRVEVGIRLGSGFGMGGRVRGCVGGLDRGSGDWGVGVGLRVARSAWLRSSFASESFSDKLLSRRDFVMLA